MAKTSPGFTLIEVLVSVMIIAVVIGSLIQLFANNSSTFSTIRQKIFYTNTTTLLLGNDTYGYTKDTTDLAELIKDFNLDDDLRRKLKNIKVEIVYSKISAIDFGDAAESVAEAQSKKDIDNTAVKDAAEASSSLEIGRTTLKIDKQSSSFLRVKFQ